MSAVFGRKLINGIVIYLISVGCRCPAHVDVQTDGRILENIERNYPGIALFRKLEDAIHCGLRPDHSDDGEIGAGQEYPSRAGGAQRGIRTAVLFAAVGFNSSNRWR